VKTRRKPHTSLRWLSYAERRRTSISPDRWAGTSPRYTDRRFFCIPYRYLQGITVRPVPCNYNVIQQISALSRR
jgi:hypothetical protein